MTFGQAITVCLRQKYCCFEGRACRSEYWYFFLFCLIVSLIAGVLPSVLSMVVSLALLCPSLAAMTRRLHDMGYSGLVCVIPLVCEVVAIFFLFTSPAMGFFLLFLAFAIGIAILVVMAMPGNLGPNKYGPEVVPSSTTAGTPAAGIPVPVPGSGQPGQPKSPATAGSLWDKLSNRANPAAGSPASPTSGGHVFGTPAPSATPGANPDLRDDGRFGGSGGFAPVPGPSSAPASAPASEPASKSSINLKKQPAPSTPSAPAAPAPSAAPKFCSSCGAPTRPGDKFCRACGARLG